MILDSAVHSPVPTLYGIEEAALESRYYMTVANLRATHPGAVREAISRLVDQGVEGVIVIAPLVSVTEALAGLTDDLPGDPLPTRPRSSQRVARRRTGRLARVHAANTRMAGDALACAGIEAPPLLRGDWGPESGFEAGLVLARMPEVTAVFVANDSMAIGVSRALHECGRAVPDDVSVIGFDDIPEAAYLNPPLMTVRQDFRQVGRRSLELLLERIQSTTGPARRDVVETSLVIRASGVRGG